MDLTKAFGLLNHEGLYKIMQKFRYPKRFTYMGCILVPTLFSLMSSAMLMDAYHDERPGIRIAYWMDGRLLNQRRMHSHSHPPSKLGQPHPQPTGLEENREDRSSNLRSQPDRRCQGQKDGAKVTSVPDQNCECPSPPNMSEPSVHIPHVIRPGPTPLDAMQQQCDNFNFCVNLSKPYFGATEGYPWYQFSHHHRDDIPILIT
ncbi:unnamed protein product [Schistocephalus solidus]|uniref:Reverse transcriptase domain-containing protein n=1 Tax=Schistocephalus solidus TaxID=70667 RepID=A0A183SG12_SCHSO|nr:unnamed protein product [Schistocephalus solidus]